MHKIIKFQMKIVIVFIIISSYKNKYPPSFSRVTRHHPLLGAAHVKLVLDLVHDALLLFAVLAMAAGRESRGASVGGSVVASRLCDIGQKMDFQVMSRDW